MPATMKYLTSALAATALTVQASNTEGETTVSANPIRKVVTMLQAVTAKVEKEGEKDAELYKKYMCYCKNADETLGASIADAGSKIPETESAIKEAEGQHAQLEEDLIKHKADREAAKKNMAEATSIREKEAAAFAAVKSEADANIAAINGAVKALEKGMAGGAFLQTQAASTLRKLVQGKEDMIEGDRQELLAFLGVSQGADYSPQSGEITGLLKQLGDEMSKNLAEATASEEEAIKNYDELMAAKTKEVNANTAAIESKTVRVGELAVSIAQMKNDLSDTAAQLIEDKKFLADLDKNCATRKEEYDVVVKTRAEELVALADTIKMLQDDDALELFKKTLPSASSFVEVASRSESARVKALALLENAEKAYKPAQKKLDFIALALHGKKIGFDKVIKMIDEMTAALKKEQVDDENKKEYCSVSFDAADDKKKGLERSVSDSEAAIESAKEAISTLNGEIKALGESIKSMDKSVAEAGEQRKEENEEFTELMAQNTAAKELLGVAKNRLNKFYNPKLYKAPPKRELSEEDRIAVNMGGTAPPTPAPGGIAGTGVTVFAQVSEHVQLLGKDAPPPPPEAVKAYSKKSGDSNSVIAMMDLLVRDLDKEMTFAETEEKNAQGAYEEMTKDAAEKRAEDSKMLGDKEAAKAEAEGSLQKHTDDKTSAAKELMATEQYISSLHAECDWLLQYFDVRKEARAGEIDALGKAKAVLSGADFSLLEVAGASHNLRGKA